MHRLFSQSLQARGQSSDPAVVVRRDAQHAFAGHGRPLGEPRSSPWHRPLDCRCKHGDRSDGGLRVRQADRSGDLSRGLCGRCMTTVGLARASRWSGRRWTAAAWLLALAAALIVGSIWTAGLVHETYWDGLWYHQPAVVALASGWNPWAGPLAGDPARAALLVNVVHTPSRGDAQLFIDHYAKGPWYPQAALVEAGARLEQAKALTSFSTWRLRSCALPPSSVFRTSIVRADGRPAGSLESGHRVSALQLLSGRAARGPRSPRSWRQAPSRSPRRSPPLGGPVAADHGAVDVKFTGLVSVVALTVGLGVSGLLCGAGCVSSPSRRAASRSSWQRSSSAGVPTSQLAIDGHPFSLAGTGAIDIVTRQAPQAAFAKDGAFEQVFHQPVLDQCQSGCRAYVP